MGSEDEAEKSLPRPGRQCDGRSKQTYELTFIHRPARDIFPPVCTENLIRVDDVMESPKLAE